MKKIKNRMNSSHECQQFPESFSSTKKFITADYTRLLAEESYPALSFPHLTSSV
jgi:hypothetical protein